MCTLEVNLNTAAKKQVDIWLLPKCRMLQQQWSSIAALPVQYSISSVVHTSHPGRPTPVNSDINIQYLNYHYVHVMSVGVTPQGVLVRHPKITPPTFSIATLQKLLWGPTSVLSSGQGPFS
jgi:hypothetical protein